MADYTFRMKAQAWKRNRSISREPVQPIEVIASTQAEAWDEARRVLGDLDRDWFWRFWLVECVARPIPSTERTGDTE